MKKFTRKQWIGAGLAVLGVLALVFSFYIKGQVDAEMGKVRSVTSPLSQTGAGGRMASGAIEARASSEASDYLQAAEFLRVGGVILIIVGGALAYFLRKKK